MTGQPRLDEARPGSETIARIVNGDAYPEDAQDAWDYAIALGDALRVERERAERCGRNVRALYKQRRKAEAERDRAREALRQFFAQYDDDTIDFLSDETEAQMRAVLAEQEKQQP